MERDERVFLLGEDIGANGGAFKVTRGFIERFGPSRVIDTPISEGGFTGAAAVPLTWDCDPLSKCSSWISFRLLTTY